MKVDGGLMPVDWACRAVGVEGRLLGNDSVLM